MTRIVQRIGWNGNITNTNQVFMSSPYGDSLGASNQTPDVENFLVMPHSGSLISLDLWVSANPAANTPCVVSVFKNSYVSSGPGNPQLHCTGTLASIPSAEHGVANQNRGHLFVDFKDSQYVTGSEHFAAHAFISIALSRTGGSTFGPTIGTLIYEVSSSFGTEFAVPNPYAGRIGE